MEIELRNRVISITNPHRQVHSNKIQNSLSLRFIFLIALYKQWQEKSAAKQNKKRIPISFICDSFGIKSIQRANIDMYIMTNCTYFF